MQRIKLALFVMGMFGFGLAACSAQPTQTQPTVAPTQSIDLETAIAPGTIPRSESEVPRVSVEEAKAALETGAAVIVDVRSPGAYETSHIAGALSIPLGEIERDPTLLPLEKEQWIITYCT